MTKESPSGEPEQIGEAMSFTAPEDKVCALCKWADRKRTMLVKEAEGSGFLMYDWPAGMPGNACHFQNEERRQKKY